MNILPSHDQREILSVIESFLASELPVSRYRDLPPEKAVYSDVVWRQLVELGWFGVTVPAEIGGSALGLSDEVLMYYEAGRNLLSPSVLATSMAVKLALILGDNELISNLVNGTARAGLANPLNIETSGNKITADLQLLDGKGVDYIVAVSRDAVMLTNKADADSLTPMPAMDSSSTLDRVVIRQKNVKAVPFSEENIGRQYQLLLATLLSGIATEAMQMAVDYAREREQYGKPIGSFQAVQHLCADMAILSEAAHYQSVMACLSLVEGKPDADIQLASAIVISRQAATNNTRQNIQIHGGMGFTKECNAQHYLKRKFVFERLLDKVSTVTAALLHY